MPRRGGRVFNNVRDTPFETHWFSRRLGWVSFLSMFAVAFIGIQVFNIFPIWLAVPIDIAMFASWLFLFVDLLNKHNPENFVSEMTVLRGLVKFARRRTHHDTINPRVR